MVTETESDVAEWDDMGVTKGIIALKAYHAPGFTDCNTGLAEV